MAARAAIHRFPPTSAVRSAFEVFDHRGHIAPHAVTLDERVIKPGGPRTRWRLRRRALRRLLRQLEILEYQLSNGAGRAAPSD